MDIEALLKTGQVPFSAQERDALQQAVANLILYDFEKLVHFLYTIDVDEKKLKSLLNEKRDEDAAKIVTELLIARQLQKMALRQQHQTGNTPDDNAERW